MLKILFGQNRGFKELVPCRKVNQVNFLSNFKIKKNENRKNEF